MKVFFSDFVVKSVKALGFPEIHKILHNNICNISCSSELLVKLSKLFRIF